MPGDETDTIPPTDERFEAIHNLLNGLAEIGTQEEPLIDYAYTMALETVTTEEHLKLLAEAMHRKLLSDASFPPVAIRLTVRMGDLSFGDVSFRSLVYTMIHSDYKDRENLRKISRNLFCNSVHFAFEFMRYFYISKYGQKRDKLGTQTHQSKLQAPKQGPLGDANGARSSRPASEQQMAPSQMSVSSSTWRSVTLNEVHLYSGMVDPLFDYLNMLIDKLATDQEMALLHYLMFLLGPKIEKLKPAKMLTLIIDIRRKIIEGQTTSRSTALLMEIVELQSHKWTTVDVAPAVLKFYANYRPSKYYLNESTADEEHQYE